MNEKKEQVSKWVSEAEKNVPAGRDANNGSKDNSIVIFSMSLPLSVLYKRVKSPAKNSLLSWWIPHFVIVVHL